jgi:hypothetical protein
MYNRKRIEKMFRVFAIAMVIGMILFTLIPLFASR